MLTILGSRRRFRDGLTQRNFPRVGGLGLAGPTLADRLRLRARSPTARQASSRAVIPINLPGGPPYIDTYDLKPDAPAE